LKSSAKKIELASVDDLFSTEEGRQDAKLEKIQEIPLSELHPFKNHPFKVKDDEAMMETADSIKQYGVLVPAIARPDPEGGYELVAGHRRHRASELAEKETMPVIVRDLDDDYYEFDEKNYCLRGRRKNKIYSLGDAITIRVARANLEKKQLDFALIEK